MPKPIMELAGRLLAGIAPVSIPLSVRSGTDPLASTVRTARALPFAVADLVEKITAGKGGVIAAADQVDMKSDGRIRS
ncbi:MAG: hypothetical protein ACR2KK_14395 [Acidimicrobiales bacterium]